MRTWEQSPVAKLAARLLSLPVRLYRLTLSPWLGSACRFNPTCSVYTLQALEERGPLSGTYLAARRIVRCHPWCSGGHDPVPSLPSSLLENPLTQKKST